MNPITYHVPLRSSMSLLSNVTKPGDPFTLRDILRNKRIQNKRAGIVEKFRAKLPKSTGNRFTVVKRVKFANGTRWGYRVTGLGLVQSDNFAFIRTKAFRAGYTHLRIGGNVIQLLDSNSNTNE